MPCRQTDMSEEWAATILMVEILYPEDLESKVPEISLWLPSEMAQHLRRQEPSQTGACGPQISHGESQSTHFEKSVLWNYWWPKHEICNKTGVIADVYSRTIKTFLKQHTSIPLEKKDHADQCLKPIEYPFWRHGLYYGRERRLTMSSSYSATQNLNIFMILYFLKLAVNQRVHFAPPPSPQVH